MLLRRLDNHFSLCLINTVYCITFFIISRVTSHMCHCVKSVRIRSYSGPHFSLSRIRTEYGETLRISPNSVRMRENAGKMGTRITPNTDTFYAVCYMTCTHL